MICAILLAAGHSTRFGANKLLQPTAEGIPLACLSARALHGMPHKVAVISTRSLVLSPLYQAAGFQIAQVAPNARSTRVVAATGVPGHGFSRPSVQTAADPEEGLALSIRTGIAASLHAQGWVLALADMPAVSPRTIARIVAALEAGATIVACRYQGQRGNPVGFSRSFGPALMALEGDMGARELLRKASESIHWLDVDDPGILFDVDTPADWLRWLALYGDPTR